jgi:hypothetical protein
MQNRALTWRMDGAALRRPVVGNHLLDGGNERAQPCVARIAGEFHASDPDVVVETLQALHLAKGTLNVGVHERVQGEGARCQV